MKNENWRNVEKDSGKLQADLENEVTNSTKAVRKRFCKKAYRVTTVMRLADKAFSDVWHTSTENEAAYGLLSRYATDTDYYGDLAFNEHSLELWSAHLGEDEGWIWVYYSSETFDHDGNIACGSWGIPSLWKVEKNDADEWVVVPIREHP